MKHILLTIGAVLIFGNLRAQIILQTIVVCAGTEKSYHIENPNEGSQYNWVVVPEDAGEIEKGQTSDRITVKWAESEGEGTLSVSEVVETCEGPAQTIKVIRVQKPKAVFNNVFVCFNDYKDLEVSFSGNPPFNLTYTLNGTEKLLENITENKITMPQIAGKLKLLAVENKACSTDLTKDNEAEIAPELKTLKIVKE